MHSLRRTSSNFLRSSPSHPAVVSRLQFAHSLSRSITLCTPTLLIPTRLVRWKSSTNKQPSDPQQEPNFLKPSEDIPSLASALKYTGEFRSEDDLTPEEKEAYRVMDPESEKDDVDYMDLYARSRAVDEDAEVVGKRKERFRRLYEQSKPKDKGVSTTSEADSNTTYTTASTRPPITHVPHETVYVGNLFFDLAAEDLRAHFEQFGTVLSATIVHDNRGISKGFGYVQFSSVEEAKTAVEKQHMQVLGGRQVVLQYARNNIKPVQEDNDATNTIYVGGIPYELTDRDLQDLFSDVVNVFDVRIPADRRSGMIRGFAHVEFLNVEAARIGKEVLSRKAPYGRKMKVEFTHRLRRGMLHSEQYREQAAEKARRQEEEERKEEVAHREE